MSSYFVLALTAKKTPRSPQVLLLDALSASPCDIYSLNDPKADLGVTQRYFGPTSLVVIYDSIDK